MILIEENYPEHIVIDKNGDIQACFSIGKEKVVLIIDPISKEFSLFESENRSYPFKTGSTVHPESESKFDKLHFELKYGAIMHTAINIACLWLQGMISITTDIRECSGE